MFRPDASRPDVIRARSGGGCVSALGLPFLAGGLVVLFLAFGVIRPSGADMHPILLILFALPFLLMGAGFVFGRAGCIIDRHQGTVTRWFGLLVPMRRTTWRLDKCGAVHLTSEVRRSNNSSYTVYPVRLAHADAAIPIDEQRTYEKARQTGEMLAEFLRLPLADDSSGEEVIREPGTLDEPLSHRLKRALGEVEIPEPPPDMQTHLRRKGHAVLLEIPPVEIDAGPMTGLLRLVANTALRGRDAARVIVGPDALRVERASAKHVGEEIPIAELEEIDLGPDEPPPNVQAAPAFLAALFKRGIVARSDKRSIEFGAHLSHAEKAYLVAVIKQVLRDF